MVCSTCTKEINAAVLRNRHPFVFCSRACAKSFQSYTAAVSLCQKCKIKRPQANFQPKRKNNFYFLAKVCDECKVKKIRKVVINFLDVKQSFEHMDVDNIEYDNGVLRIYSRRDGKEYLYPLVNLLKVEILH